MIPYTIVARISFSNHYTLFAGDSIVRANRVVAILRTREPIIVSNIPMIIIAHDIDTVNAHICCGDALSSLPSGIVKYNFETRRNVRATDLIITIRATNQFGIVGIYRTFEPILGWY